ncbi:hypothetical protein DY000_02033208 [Brassica cretica]|uniref:Uncharacterized protein n=1 Tax=Brassica cretica TaxID=69181 RepID=A0ABQ7DDX3_BRACR|nr:hypothetical protein DY000_02033208 [Brassica cretica]
MIVVPESEIIKPPKAGTEEAIEMWTEVALVVPESEIIKPPKAGAEEAIEMWTEVALGATFLFWKAINMKCRGELMGVDMLLLHAMSSGVIKYHFSGPFILATSDMVEEVYVTAEGSE